MPKGAPQPPQKPPAAVNKPPVNAGAPAAERAAASRRAVTPARMPKGSASPLVRTPASSRTTTLDDPMTTSLLAEISRRSRTVEIAAEQIEDAIEIAPGADRDAAAIAAGAHAAPGDRDPTDDAM